MTGNEYEARISRLEKRMAALRNALSGVYVLIILLLVVFCALRWYQARSIREELLIIDEKNTAVWSDLKQHIEELSGAASHKINPTDYQHKIDAIKKKSQRLIDQDPTAINDDLIEIRRKLLEDIINDTVLQTDTSTEHK